MMRPPVLKMKKRNNQGFTLLELMVIIAIAGILASIAVPSYQKMLERNRLREALEGMKSDLQWMRTETFKRSCNLNASFNSAAWSYTIYRTAGTCQCPTGSNCNDKVVSGSQFTGISMSNVSFAGGGTSTYFDFRTGTTPIAGNIQLDSATYHAKVVVAPVGRVRICNINGLEGLIGYETC